MTEQTASSPWAMACHDMLDCALINCGTIVMSRVFDCRTHAEACARDMTLMAICDPYPDHYRAVPLPMVVRS